MKTIPLSQGKVALVDDEDYERVNHYKWRLLVIHGNEYAHCHSPMVNGKRVTLMIHRVITNAAKGQEVDHRDNNGLNNQKSNLRFCNRSQNNANRSVIRAITGLKGVRFVPKATLRPWNARIVSNERLIDLGYFRSSHAAAAAYNQAATRIFGEFAKLNTL